MLLDKPLESHPLEPNVDLPPPSFLKRKIIIKNKKKHHHHHHHHKKAANTSTTTITLSQATNQSNAVLNPPILDDTQCEQNTSVTTGNGDVTHHNPPLQQIRQSSKDSTGSSDTDSSSDDESTPLPQSGAVDSAQPDKVPPTKETEAGAEISALVNYVQPVHFSSFENSESEYKLFIMAIL